MLSTALPFGAQADDAALPANEGIVVTAKSISELNILPNTTESITADQIEKTVNVMTPEDTVKYLPNVLIRQRHPGDTQSPITTRTSGVGASARSLIYVDGVLISSLIGNNNTSASPKWGLLSPDAIARVDVLYGPFSAAYAGNSIGSVIAFTTQMPTKFEAGAEVQGALQSFAKYGEDRDYGTTRFSVNVGDAFGKLSFRLSYNHLDNRGQPLGYATAVVPATTSATGTPVSGAFTDANRTGSPIAVLGSTGVQHQAQDNASGRVSLDLTPTVVAAYTFGLFHNRDDSTVHSYLRDAAGQPAYAGALNIGGRAYTVAANAFSNSVYRLTETQLAQGLSVGSQTDGLFDFEVVGSLFNYLDSHQRLPTVALPTGFTGGAGAAVNLDGTGWYTFDAKGVLRPSGGAHVLTFGAHQDRFTLKNPRYALADWTSSGEGALQSTNAGRTKTDALWLQDAWDVLPDVKATLGGRYERWRAYDGVNFSASPVLNVAQPALAREAFSPKLVVAYEPNMDWTLKGSVGVAYRFPTVTELYQAITTGATLSVPNPNLQPERAISSELSVARRWSTGDARISVFDERIRNTLLFQSAPLPAGSTIVANFVQNVDRTHATGVELVARQRDVLIPGLELSGWVTYVKAKVDANAVFAAAVGKNIPQLPRLRGALVATYAPTEVWSFTLAGRYSDRSFATIDNSDYYANTYQGFGAYFVLDARFRYQINRHVAAEVGVNNLNDRAYILFHPFPQRTLVAGLKYTY